MLSLPLNNGLQFEEKYLHFIDVEQSEISLNPVAVELLELLLLCSSASVWLFRNADCAIA